MKRRRGIMDKSSILRTPIYILYSCRGKSEIIIDCLIDGVIFSVPALSCSNLRRNGMPMDAHAQ